MRRLAQIHKRRLIYSADGNAFQRCIKREISVHRIVIVRNEMAQFRSVAFQQNAVCLFTEFYFQVFKKVLICYRILLSRKMFFKDLCCSLTSLCWENLIVTLVLNRHRKYLGRNCSLISSPSVFEVMETVINDPIL